MIVFRCLSFVKRKGNVKKENWRVFIEKKLKLKEVESLAVKVKNIEVLTLKKKWLQLTERWVLILSDSAWNHSLVGLLSLPKYAVFCSSLSWLACFGCYMALTGTRFFRHFYWSLASYAGSGFGLYLFFLFIRKYNA